MCATAQVPVPFPLDFDIDDDPCLVCNGALGADWICTTCKADHFVSATRPPSCRF